MRPLSICTALMFASLTSVAESAPRLIWQPVQEYFIRIQPGKPQIPVAGTKRLNSFVTYTHLGTDFGFHGPAEHEIEWQQDELRVHLGQQPEGWAGMWHSLAGLAREEYRTLDFSHAWPDIIADEYQPQITKVMIKLSGNGRVKLEIKSPRQELLWTRSFDVSSKETRAYVADLPTSSLREAKLLNWTAEPGSELSVQSLQLGVELPDSLANFDTYVVAASYAKLARCFDPSTGLVKDRAHLEGGVFESIPATGMFALATAALSQGPLPLVSPEAARAVVHRIDATIRGLQRPYGLLPHFVSRRGDRMEIHPGTEYSSVDTAIYYQSLLLCSRLLKEPALEAELISAMDQVDFTALALPEGIVSHGLKTDGKTLLQHGWQDWGGETALVMMLQHMVNENAPHVPMQRPGQAWQGTGFITEIQSLFFPDFDSDEPDALDKVKWLSVRRGMLSAQKDYIQQTWPGSMAAKMGLYGLSAGESEHGNSYLVGGTALANQELIHPHYILMAGTVAENPAEVYDLLQRVRDAGYFPPWGLVENLTVSGSSYLPMIGSLNAAFEALGGLHLLTKSRGLADPIYQANRECPELRRGVSLFYPPATATIPQPVQTARLLPER